MSTVIYTNDRSVLNESRELDILESSLGTGVIEGMVPRPGTNAFDIDLYGGKFAIQGVVIEETAEIQDAFTLSDDTQYQLFAAYFPGDAANDPLVDGLGDLGYTGYVTGEVFYGLSSQAISTGSVGSPDIVTELEGTSNALSAKYVVVLADIYVPAGEANLSGTTRFNVPSRIPDIRQLQNKVNEHWQMVVDQREFKLTGLGSGTHTLEITWNNMSLMRARPAQRWAGPGNARMDMVDVFGKDTPTDAGTYSQSTRTEMDETWDFAIAAVRGSTGEMEVYGFKANEYGFVISDEDAHQEVFGNTQGYAGVDEHPYIPDFEDVYVVATLYNGTPPYAIWSDGVSSILSRPASGGHHYTTLESTDYGTSVGRSDFGVINIDGVITNTDKLEVLGLDEAYDSAESGSADGAGRDIAVDAGAIDILLDAGPATADPQNSMWRSAIDIQMTEADGWESGINVLSDQIGDAPLSTDRYGFRHYTIFEGEVNDWDPNLSTNTLLASDYRLDEEPVILHWNGADVELQFSIGGTAIMGEDLYVGTFGGASGTVLVYIDAIGENRLFRLSYPEGSPPILKDYDGTSSVEGYITGVTSGDISTQATFWIASMVSYDKSLFAREMTVGGDLSATQGITSLDDLTVNGGAGFQLGATFSDNVILAGNLDLYFDLNAGGDVLLSNGNVDADGDPSTGTGLVSAHEFHGYLPSSPDQSDRLILRPVGGAGTRAEASFRWLTQAGNESPANVRGFEIIGDALKWNSVKTNKKFWDISAVSTPSGQSDPNATEESFGNATSSEFHIKEGSSSDAVYFEFQIDVPAESELDFIKFWYRRQSQLYATKLSVDLFKVSMNSNGTVNSDSLASFDVTGNTSNDPGFPDDNGVWRDFNIAISSNDIVNEGDVLVARLSAELHGGPPYEDTVRVRGLHVQYNRSEPSW